MAETTSPLSLPMYKGIELPDISKQNYAGVGEDPSITEANQKLIKAREEAADALEKRFAQPNWFKIAAGFAKPQLGGFTASLGSAAEAAGDWQEQQRAVAPTIAMMRAQTAAQQVGVEQKLKGQQLFKDLLANPNDKPLDKIAQIGKYDSELARVAQERFGNLRGVFSDIVRAKELGMSRAQLEAKYGKYFVDQVYNSEVGNVPNQNAAPAAIAAPAAASATSKPAPANAVNAGNAALAVAGLEPAPHKNELVERLERQNKTQPESKGQDWASSNYHVEPPPRGNMPLETYLSQQEKNRDQSRNESTALNQLVSQDQNFTGRRENLKRVVNLLTDSDVRDYATRAAPNELTALVNAAATSNTSPDFLRSMIEKSNFVKPGEDPKKVAKFQEYIQSLAREQQFINNTTANSTNAKFGMEQSAGIQQATLPSAANRYALEELHKMQRLATLSGLVQPYVEQGYGWNDALNSKRVQDYTKDWTDVHNRIGKHSDKFGLPTFLADPEAFSPGYDYRKHKKVQ